MDSKELLKKAESILENEGELNKKDYSPMQKVDEFILPAMQASKDVLSPIYAFKSRGREGFLGKLKTMIQNKIIFTVINVIEKQSMKQQKFNELTFRAIEQLSEENKSLRKQLESK